MLPPLCSNIQSLLQLGTAYKWLHLQVETRAVHVREGEAMPNKDYLLTFGGLLVDQYLTTRIWCCLKIGPEWNLFSQVLDDSWLPLQTDGSDANKLMLVPVEICKVSELHFSTRQMRTPWKCMNHLNKRSIAILDHARITTESRVSEHEDTWMGAPDLPAEWIAHCSHELLRLTRLQDFMRRGRVNLWSLLWRQFYTKERYFKDVLHLNENLQSILMSSVEMKSVPSQRNGGFFKHSEPDKQFWWLVFWSERYSAY